MGLIVFIWFWDEIVYAFERFSSKYLNMKMVHLMTPPIWYIKMVQSCIDYEQFVNVHENDRNLET